MVYIYHCYTTYKNGEIGHGLWHCCSNIYSHKIEGTLTEKTSGKFTIGSACFSRHILIQTLAQKVLNQQVILHILCHPWKALIFPMKIGGFQVFLYFFSLEATHFPHSIRGFPTHPC